jgi:hypothetical protein
MYHNYKQYHSIILQSVADANNIFAFRAVTEVHFYIPSYCNNSKTLFFLKSIYKEEKHFHMVLSVEKANSLAGYLLSKDSPRHAQ